MRTFMVRDNRFNRIFYVKAYSPTQASLLVYIKKIVPRFKEMGLPITKRTFYKLLRTKTLECFPFADPPRIDFEVGRR